MEEKANIVRVTNVTKNFKLGKIEVEALKGIDLEISKGRESQCRHGLPESTYRPYCSTRMASTGCIRAAISAG